MSDFLDTLSKEQLMALAELGLAQVLDVHGSHSNVQFLAGGALKETLTKTDIERAIEGIEVNIDGEEATMKQQEVSGVADDIHAHLTTLTEASTEVLGLNSERFLESVQTAISMGTLIGPALFKEGLSPEQWWDTAQDLQVCPEVWAAMIRTGTPEQMEAWLSAAPPMSSSIIRATREWVSVAFSNDLKALEWLPVLMEPALGETTMPWSGSKKINLDDSREKAMSNAWGRLCASFPKHPTPRPHRPALLDAIASYVPTGWNRLDWESIGRGDKSFGDNLVSPQVLVTRLRQIITEQPALTKTWFDTPLLEPDEPQTSLKVPSHSWTSVDDKRVLSNRTLSYLIKDGTWEGEFGTSFRHFQEIARALDAALNDTNSYTAALSSFLLDHRWQAAPSKPKPRF